MVRWNARIGRFWRRWGLAESRVKHWRPVCRTICTCTVTPHSITGVSAAELMFGRRFRDKFPHLNEEPIVEEEVKDRDLAAKFEAKLTVIWESMPRSRTSKSAIKCWWRRSTERINLHRTFILDQQWWLTKMEIMLWFGLRMERYTLYIIQAQLIAFETDVQWFRWWRLYEFWAGRWGLGRFCS